MGKKHHQESTRWPHRYNEEPKTAATKRNLSS